MVFSSLTFLFIFLPVIMLVYFAVPKKYRAIRNYVLLVFSVIFYSWGEPVYIFLIIFQTTITYMVSKKVSYGGKIALFIGTAANLIPLIVFKYSDFILGNINLLPRIEIPLPNLILPIGISFYTFHKLTYLIDLYRKKVAWQKNPMYLALYVFLFPQLVAGPIVRYVTVENEIENRNENWADFKAGGTRFVIGLAKKVLIANQAGFIVKTIMEQDASKTGAGLLWLSAFSFAIQIYFDFSGYSDMAIGMGKMFGFHFLENFNYPYISRSITEFWRRWHISMSTFFRDYVYISMGGNRVPKYRWLVNMFVVWFLTGMWHGALWNFIFWGLYFCMLLIIEKFLLRGILERIPSIFSWTYTFLMTLFGWVIFMNETNNPLKILNVFKNMFSFKSVEYGMTIRSLEIQAYIPYLLIGFIISFPIFKKISEIKLMKNVVVGYVGIVLVIMLYCISFVYIIAGSFNPFMYFRF